MPRVTQALGGRRGLSTALPLCTLVPAPRLPSVSFQWNELYSAQSCVESVS